MRTVHSQIAYKTFFGYYKYYTSLLHTAAYIEADSDEDITPFL